MVCLNTDWVVDTCVLSSYSTGVLASHKLGHLRIITIRTIYTPEIMGISDIHIETNVGCKLILKM